MCGLAGFFDPENGLTEDLLQRMTDAEAHRGPDASGHYKGDGFALGHRRLSILDLSSAANQPMLSHNGRARIVYNGEVYNFKEIASELGIQLNTSSDTEVILEAYLKWGPGFVHRLNGMFTIAIYDEDKQELFLCRDRLGIKPLYYSWDGKSLIFASELKCLISLRPERKFTLNRQAVQDYLLLGYVPEPLSIFNEVKKFPSGSYALTKKGDFCITSYWQPGEKLTKEVLSDEQQAFDTLKNLVESSVQYRMISDVPFGTFLSGGIDSSLVTAVAQSLSDKPVKTFSIGFKEARYNEASYAKAVSDHLKTMHHEFMVTEADAMDMIDRMTDACDEPFADSSAIPTMLVSKLARQHVTMTLSGDGGDELFLGYGSYRWAERMANPFVRLLRKPIGMALNASGNNRFRRAAMHFNYENYRDIRTHIFSQEIYYFSEAELRRLYKHSTNKFSVEATLEKLPRKLTAAEEQALFDIRYYLKDDLLTKVDRSSMQFSLETRVPLLDYRIVEFALNLDPTLKYRNGTSKYLLKKLLFQYVPASLFDRPKWGFSIPLERWLQKDLNFLISKYCSEEICERYDLICYPELKKYIQQFGQGRTYLYNRIWQVIVLHKYLESIRY